MSKLFDFIIIGAMKSGTTTLHNLLSLDNRISLPVNKEAPFFTLQNEIDCGYEAFISKYYKSHFGKIIGKITPHYMMYTKLASKNIHLLSPDTKIIAILRDPIERLVSHYSMCVGLGLETRNINKAIQDCLDNSLHNDIEVTPTNSYISCSEYGAILAQFNTLLKQENILVLNFNQLLNEQELVVKQIYEHIGLTYYTLSNKAPNSLKRGGKGVNLKKLIYRLGIAFRSLIILFLSEKTRLALRFKFIELKIEAYAPNYRITDIDSKLIFQLKQQFKKDGELLLKIGLSPYWINVYTNN